MAQRSRAWFWIYAGIAIVSSLEMFGKINLLGHAIPLPKAAIAGLLAICVCLPLAWAVAIRWRRVIAPMTIVLLLLALLVGFPKVQELHRTGRGTDQPDCVIVAASHMMRGEWPYQRAEMWTRNPMSCGPGWTALQAPMVTTVGYAGDMIVIWAVSLGALTWVIGWSDTAALLTLLCLSPAFWMAALNGSDFLPFGLAVTALLAVLEKVGQSLPKRMALGALAGMLGQFRIATLLLPAFLARRLGRAAAMAGVLLSLLFEVAFLRWNAASFISDGPLHIAFKATSMHLISTQPLAASIEICLPVLALAVGTVLLAGRFRERVGVVAYFGVIFLIPALLDLVKKHSKYGWNLNMLQYWEGGLWLSACLPLLALLAVSGEGEEPSIERADPIAAADRESLRVSAG